MANEFKENKEAGSAAEDKRQDKETRPGRGRNSKSKGGNRQPHRNNGRARDNMRTSSSKTGKTNDASWYANDAALLKSAASFPFSTSTGEQIEGPALNSVPGVFSIFWNPIIGAGNAINQAAAQTYSFVVHANSRSKSYSQSDLMLTIIAGANVFSAIAAGLRVYGTMRKFLQQNKYTPEALVYSMGFDYKDLKDNLSDMWFDLNELISETESIWIPDKFDLIKRWFWLNSNIYKDGSLTKDQYYLYVQDKVLKYDETTLETGTQLVPSDKWGSMKDRVAKKTFMKWSEYVDAVRELIALLLNSEDRGIMYGDLMKAYGQDSLYTIAPVDSSYSVEPVFDQEVLTQIENAQACAADFIGFKSLPNGDIEKQWGPIIPSSSLFMPERKVLNFHDIKDPTPADIMVATRLSYGRVRLLSKTDNKWVVEAYDMGSELVSMFCITDYVYTDNAQGVTVGELTFTTFLNSNTSLSSKGFAKWAAFDWAPWLYMCSTTIASVNAGDFITPDKFECYVGDWANYTLLDPKDIRKLNYTAVRSELGINSAL